MSDDDLIEYGQAYGILNQWIRIWNIREAHYSGDNGKMENLLEMEITTMVLAISRMWAKSKNKKDLLGLIKTFDDIIWTNYKDECRNVEVANEYEQIILEMGIR